MDPQVIERLSRMGPVAHLIALLALFVVVLLKVWRTRRDAFWPALTTGLIGVLIGGGTIVAGIRILSLKVLNPAEIQRLEQGGSSRTRARWQGGSRRGWAEEQGKIGLVVLVRRLDAITAAEPGFLDNRQAGAVISLLEMVLPMPDYSDREATEMVADLSARFTIPQQHQIRAAQIPTNLGLAGSRGWLSNPLQSDVNKAAIIALIGRYDHLERTVLTPQMLDF